jgi:Ca2+-binding EF-hand superfamily protein
MGALNIVNTCGGSIVKYHVMFLGAALVCASAMAQSQSEPATQNEAQASASTMSVFDSLDANKDGRISQEEAQGQPVVSQNFAKADANKDGAITREEFTSAFTARAPDSAPPPASPAPEPPR